jgi:hypothetical protein
MKWSILHAHGIDAIVRIAGSHGPVIKSGDDGAYILNSHTRTHGPHGTWPCSGCARSGKRSNDGFVCALADAVSHAVKPKDGEDLTPYFIRMHRIAERIAKKVASRRT